MSWWCYMKEMFMLWERFIYFCLENNLIVGKIMFKYKDINMMILNILNVRVKN